MATKGKHGATKDTGVCGACQQPIVPYWDGEAGQYLNPALTVLEGEDKGKVYHVDCMDHVRLWERITALEELVKKLNRASGRGEVTGDA